MPQYLVDTNVLSESGRQRPSPLVAQRMSQREPDIATAAPVFAELLFGMYRLPPSRRRRDVERYVISAVRGRLPILPYDEAAADWHAAERARLERLGLTAPFVDGQIAAIAAVNGLTLVTLNVRDFQHFQSLQIEDWSV
ncbi:MAG: type II toxin-antitoxin system VapC family toxin [Dehalococcoidia bacterium]